MDNCIDELEIIAPGGLDGVVQKLATVGVGIGQAGAASLNATGTALQEWPISQSA